MLNKIINIPVNSKEIVKPVGHAEPVIDPVHQANILKANGQ